MRLQGNIFYGNSGNYNKDFIVNDNLEDNFDNVKAEAINKSRPEIVKYPILSKQINPTYNKITIVYGDMDIYQTSKNFVIDRFPTAEKYTISNCGHLPWLHNFVEFKKVMEEHYGNL